MGLKETLDLLRYHQICDECHKLMDYAVTVKGAKLEDCVWRIGDEAMRIIREGVARNMMWDIKPGEDDRTQFLGIVVVRHPEPCCIDLHGLDTHPPAS